MTDTAVPTATRFIRTILADNLNLPIEAIGYDGPLTVAYAGKDEASACIFTFPTADCPDLSPDDVYTVGLELRFFTKEVGGRIKGAIVDHSTTEPSYFDATAYEPGAQQPLALNMPFPVVSIATYSEKTSLFLKGEGGYLRHTIDNSIRASMGIELYSMHNPNLFFFIAETDITGAYRAPKINRR